MKLTVLILFISCSNICFGQSVRFQLYRTKACSTIEKLDSSYWVYKVGALFDTSYSPKSGIAYLPGPGKYGVSGIGPIVDTVFDIRDTGLFIARLREPDAGLYITGAFDTPPLYT